jgi:hypothetical protein
LAFFDTEPGYHLRLHRVWAFAKLQAELTYREHVHILHCKECNAAFQVCLKHETFGAVLKELRREDEHDGGEESRAS